MLKNYFNLIWRILLLIPVIIGSGYIVYFNFNALYTNPIIRSIFMVAKIILTAFIPIWIGWLIFSVFLMTKFKETFMLRFENFSQSIDYADCDGKIVKRDISKYSPILVLKGYIDKRQVELVSAETYKNDSKKQTAQDRLHFAFGYVDIYKELEIRNLEDFDKIVIIISPIWNAISWFPFVPKIHIEMKVDGEYQRNYIDNTINLKFDNIKRKVLVYKPFAVEKYDVINNYAE
jgi:hypothetical protein